VVVTGSIGGLAGLASLAASGGLANATTNSGTITASLVQDPINHEGLDLVLNESATAPTPTPTPTPTTTPTPTPAPMTPNQQAVVTALNNAGGPGQPFLNDVVGSGQPSVTLNELSGQNLTINLKAGLGGSFSFLNLLDDHLLVGDARTNVEFASLDPTQEARMGLLDDDGTTGAWARGYGTFGDGSATTGNSPFTDRRSGVVGGLDGRFGEGMRGGFAFDYGHTAVNFTDGSGATNLDSYAIAAYGGWHAGAWYASGIASFAWNDYGTSRLFPALGLAPASGNFSGQSYGAEGQLGYVIQQQGFAVAPDLTLIYAHARTDAFTETGSMASLTVAAANSDSLQTILGVRASTTLMTSMGRVLPEVRAGWSHEFLNASQSITAAFVAAPASPFTVVGANYGRDSAVVGAGVAAEISPNAKLYIDYDGKFTGGFNQNAVSAGFRVQF
jgi:uncharacterized protein with beta-barrel porin domain